jgi:hypothetical protein
MTDEELQALPIGSLVRVHYRKIRYGTLINKNFVEYGGQMHGQCDVRLKYSQDFRPIKNTTHLYGAGWVDPITREQVVNEVNTMFTELELDQDPT